MSPIDERLDMMHLGLGTIVLCEFADSPLLLCVQLLYSFKRVVDEHEDGPFLLRLDGVELRCRSGNKTFRFPLKP